LVLRITVPVQQLAIALLGCLLAAPIGSDAVAAERPPTGEHYFIDFRSRPSTYIGHTYIVYGRVNASGRVIEKHHAGLIPEENVWKGIFSPIRATIRKYKDDTRLAPTVIYRRSMTAAEYHRVARTVKAERIGPQGKCV
jgi:hypothetical protein